MSLQQIIVLQGSASKGKTSCLNNLIDLLKQYEEKTYTKIATERANDHRRVFVYQKTRIAITTYGDPPGETIEKNIDFAEKNECTILITASRSRGATVDVIEAYRLKHTNVTITFVAKEIVSNGNKSLQDEVNKTQAQDLMKLLNKTLKKGTSK